MYKIFIFTKLSLSFTLTTPALTRCAIILFILTHFQTLNGENCSSTINYLGTMLAFAPNIL